MTEDNNSNQIDTIKNNIDSINVLLSYINDDTQEISKDILEDNFELIKEILFDIVKLIENTDKTVSVEKNNSFNANIKYILLNHLLDKITCKKLSLLDFKFEYMFKVEKEFVFLKYPTKIGPIMLYNNEIVRQIVCSVEDPAVFEITTDKKNYMNISGEEEIIIANV